VPDLGALEQDKEQREKTMITARPIQGTISGGRRARWIIDPDRTKVGFRVGLMKVATVRGRLGRLKGTAMLDDEAPHWSRVDLSVDATSIDTRNRLRDAHLRTGDYLDVGRYPNITFESTHVVPLDAATYLVTGDLTIRGITRAISVDVSLDEASAYRLGRRGFTARTRLDRREYGVDPGVAGFGFLIGGEVVISVRGEAFEHPRYGDGIPGEEARRCANC
jgi:polyisoprenoid-binding protein YceI